MSLRRLEVAAVNGRYPILIGAGLLREPSTWARLVPGRRVLIVTDDCVAPHYLAPVRAALSDRVLAQHVLPAGEAAKTLQNCEAVFAELAHLGLGRDGAVLALGGGVVGDLAGFAAACWMRGVAVVQLPTTLLAMVDSSVGGKTAVNLPQGKNLVGAFHPPAAVVADTDALATLPVREFHAGLAEVLKYGAISDAAFFDRCHANAAALVARDASELAQAIEHACRMKAEIVARDPLERGERALLNFGHTFGHALETASGYGELRHGEAVAIGMVLAATLSARLGMASDVDARRLSEALLALGLPTRMPAGHDPDTLLAAMRLDKKNLDDRLRLILWHGIGQACIVPDVPQAQVRALLTQACAGD